MRESRDGRDVGMGVILLALSLAAGAVADGSAGSRLTESSPWAHGERVFCLSEQGETFVIEAGDGFRVQRTNVINEMSLATPALAHGSPFLRTATRLYRIGG